MHVGTPVTSILWDVPHSMCHRKPDEIGVAASTVSCKTRFQTSFLGKYPFMISGWDTKTNEESESLQRKLNNCKVHNCSSVLFFLLMSSVFSQA